MSNALQCFHAVQLHPAPDIFNRLLSMARRAQLLFSAGNLLSISCNNSVEHALTMEYASPRLGLSDSRIAFLIVLKFPRDTARDGRMCKLFAIRMSLALIDWETAFVRGSLEWGSNGRSCWDGDSSLEGVIPNDFNASNKINRLAKSRALVLRDSSF